MPRQFDIAGRAGFGEFAGPRGGSRPNPFTGDDVEQSNTINDDGNTVISLEATIPNGETVTRTLTIANAGDNQEGTDITVNNTRPDGTTHSRTLAISEDSDGGVDITISSVTPDGETRTKIVEIDEGDLDRFDFSVTFTNRDGDIVTWDHSHRWERILEDVEELSVGTVADAFLEYQGVDLLAIDPITMVDFA